MDDFTIGQVVEQFASARRMVVAFIPGDGSARDRKHRQGSRNGEIGCEWFDRRRELRSGLFDRTSLLPVAPHGTAFPAEGRIETGHAVQLKSGGPVMTTVLIAGDRSVLDWSYSKECDRGDIGCQWFDPSGKVRMAFFKPPMLALASAAEGRPQA